MPLVEAFQTLSISNEGTKERPRFEATALQLLQTISQSIVQIKSNVPSKISAEELKHAQGELEEFTLVNRDLYLWCDALEESHLQIDIFICVQDAALGASHTLMERWILKCIPSSSPSISSISSSSSSPPPHSHSASSSLSSPPSPHSLHSVSATPSPHSPQTEDAQLAEFGKYLSSLIGPYTSASIPEVDNIKEQDTPTKSNHSESLAELHKFVGTMPLHKWVRNNSQSIHQVYGSTRSSSPLSFSGTIDNYEFPVFNTRCASFDLSVTYMREIDWDLFRSEERRKVSVITAPSCSWSTASCHAKHAHPSHPIPLVLPHSYPIDRDISSSDSFHSSNTSSNITPPSTPPRSFSFQLQQLNSSHKGATPLSTSPAAVHGFFLPSTSPSAAHYSRSPTKIYPISPVSIPSTQGFNVSALSSSLRSPRGNTSSISPTIIPTTPPSQSFFPASPTSSPFSSISSLTPTPPRSTAIRIPGTQPAFEPTSPSSSPSPSPSSSPFPSPSPNARRTLFKSPSRHSHHPSPSPSSSSFHNHNHNHPHISPPASPSTVDIMGALGGSFQESIMLGHMSSTTSTTFPGFVADLGVSGKDFIPPHKKVPFEAVYYHVDPDTPYVGTVELNEKGYRVPQKGLIQLTVFNPKNTPVKTFLVNFDLTGMTPDTKTFLRQKIVTNDPPILRYAIHLRFVCPKKKRFYLYNNIRVVFPHRVPDEMEKLRVIYDAPSDPKFFPWTDNVEQNLYH